MRVTYENLHTGRCTYELTTLESQAGYAATNFDEGAEVSATISMGQIRTMEDA